MLRKTTQCCPSSQEVKNKFKTDKAAARKETLMDKTEQQCLHFDLHVGFLSRTQSTVCVAVVDRGAHTYHFKIQNTPFMDACID